ncbi:MAG: phosphate acyltransferase PlsX [Pseudomonadota bacterium]|nr:phosphate acyltransferase PlsX [Pseudomonadota bacterium]
MRIAIDAMGGDHGPPAVIPAAVAALRKHANLHVVLVGDEAILTKALSAEQGVPSTRVSIRHATQQVEMDESPSQALRTKKDSSMRVAIDLVKEGEADACVSAGNTGALMAKARFVLKMLPGIDRPAICCALPAMQGHSHVLDLGANVDSSPEQLLQFALMGAALTSAVENKPAPSVALLNVGEEEAKGDGRVKQAAMLISQSNLNYVGFVEGDAVFKGSVDVIVCDGFVGNIALKASEGAGRMFLHFAKEEFLRTPLTRLAAWVSGPVLKAAVRRIDPRRYNGATLLGLRGIVIKSHGSADQVSFAYAIDEAVLEVEKRVPDLISKDLELIFDQRRAV